MNLHCLTRRASVAALTLVCTSFSLLSVADTGKAANPVTYDFATAQTARNEVQSHLTAGRAAMATRVGGATTAPSGVVPPGEAFVNAYRAYPPSCLESGHNYFGSFVNDPFRVQAQVRLYGDPNFGSAAEHAFSEIDTITVWRVVCSSGQSATLLEIDRPAGHDATLYPVLPLISVLQGSNNIYVRLGEDPNTFFASTGAFAPLGETNAFVLENYYGISQQFNYNNAFVLTVDNLNTSDPFRYTQFSLPSYNAAAYAESALPLPISGYMSTNWTSMTQGGEGIVMQVYDDRDGATRTLAFAWFTYDNMGLPFWLFGEADQFPIGTRSVTAPTAYFYAGTFAGSNPNGVPHTIWGTVTFSFPDCAHMNISYNGNASAVNGPTGSGSATYKRVADVNGLVCQ